MLARILRWLSPGWDLQDEQYYGTAPREVPSRYSLFDYGCDT